MANGDKTRRQWLLAVTVSIVLHGAIIAGLGLIAGRTDVVIEASPKPQFMPITFIDGGGDVTFEEPRATKASPNQSQNGSHVTKQDPAPPTALLRDPWAVVATTDGNSESSQVAESSGHQDANTNGTTSFFNITARGRRIVYLLDGSASMGTHGAMATACRELAASLRRLPPDARFQVVVYNSQACNLLPRLAGWLQPTPTIVQEASAALTRQVAEGGTDHGPALRRALQLGPDVIFLLTDADDLKPEHVSLVRSLNQGHAIIHTIELTTRNRERIWMPLQVLARENRGTYQAVDLEP
jgi:hypothetical protein